MVQHDIVYDDRRWILVCIGPMQQMYSHALNCVLKLTYINQSYIVYWCYELGGCAKSTP